MKPVIGLTGGIGSGKSTVADRFAALGAGVVDTDAIAHRLTGPQGAAMPALREAFGPGVADATGALDRAAMRQAAFTDPAVRARLEGLLHPLIRQAAEQDLAAVRGPYALLVVPLLFETGAYAGRVSRTLVVDCPEALQVARVGERSGLAEAEVRAIMAAQWPRWRRLQLADDVVSNAGTPGDLEAQCGRLHAAYARRG